MQLRRNDFRQRHEGLASYIKIHDTRRISRWKEFEYLFQAGKISVAFLLKRFVQGTLSVGYSAKLYSFKWDFRMA